MVASVHTATEHRSFNCIRQVVPICTSTQHLIHVPLGLPNIYSKQHLDQFSNFCNAHSHDRHTDKQITLCTDIYSNSPPTPSTSCRPKSHNKIKTHTHIITLNWLLKITYSATKCSSLMP